MKNILLLITISTALLFTSCDNQATCLPVTTAANANQAQFLGLWYEIASIPQFFNIGCQCTTAEYIDNGTNITVRNSCRLGGAVLGIPNNIEGYAFAPNPADFSKLKVRFPVSPVDADYWILRFDSNGNYMMVGDPDKNTLFILSRTRTLDSQTYNGLVNLASAMCFDVGDLRTTNQSNCTGN